MSALLTLLYCRCHRGEGTQEMDEADAGYMNELDNAMDAVGLDG